MKVMCDVMYSCTPIRHATLCIESLTRVCSHVLGVILVAMIHIIRNVIAFWQQSSFRC